MAETNSFRKFQVKRRDQADALPQEPFSELGWKMRGRAQHALGRKAALALLLILSVARCSRAQSAVETTSADFYVGGNGRDGWSGRFAQPNAALTDGPFATLGRARDAVRELKKHSARKNLVVRIRGGTYRLQETLVFSLEDSAPNGGTITYAAYPHEEPIFVFGRAHL